MLSGMWMFVVNVGVMVGGLKLRGMKLIYHVVVIFLTLPQLSTYGDSHSIQLPELQPYGILREPLDYESFRRMEIPILSNFLSSSPMGSCENPWTMRAFDTWTMRAFDVWRFSVYGTPDMKKLLGISSGGTRPKA
ncbi:hypothetical protein J6590_006693 [Homalodisca vitripennis]|nr:hypothetical protein J6590_006693 [Homalodisca vitripennis]